MDKNIAIMKCTEKYFIFNNKMWSYLYYYYFFVRDNTFDDVSKVHARTNENPLKLWR